MKTRIRWLENLVFVGESPSGHALVMDGASEAGLGTRPMETVLLGLGGCTAVDVVTILKKARQQVEDCVIEIEAERADSIPRVFTRIHIHYRVFGHSLAEHHVRRAVNLSAEKYCSVSAMLRASVAITHDFELVDSDQGSAS